MTVSGQEWCISARLLLRISAARPTYGPRYGTFWISCPESHTLLRKRGRNVRHSPSPQSFRFWCHSSGADEFDRRRNCQLSISHNPRVCYSLVAILVSCLGRDVAGRAIRGANDTSGIGSIDARRLMIRTKSVKQNRAQFSPIRVMNVYAGGGLPARVKAWIEK